MQEPEGKHGGDRQSIWSIPKSEQATYFSLFSIFLFLGLVFLAYHETLVLKTEQSATVIRNIIAQTAVSGAAAAVLSLATAEGGRLSLVAARYIEERYPNPLMATFVGSGFALVERFDWTEALTRRDLRIENEERWIWTNSTQSRRFCRIVSRLRWIAKQIREIDFREIDFKEVCSCNNGWRS